MHDFYQFIHAFDFLKQYLCETTMDVLRQHIKPGEVYRRSDLEYYSSAIDRHLGILTKDGSLLKLSQGLYYAPKSTKFGIAPPDDSDLVECFLKDNNFLIVNPNLYNRLGLGLTQLYNTTWVYNHKRKGEFKLNGKIFEFKIKSSFPNQLTKAFLLVDLLNNIDELAESQHRIVQFLSNNFNSFNKDELLKVAQQYGSGKTKQFIKSYYRNKMLHA